MAEENNKGWLGSAIGDALKILSGESAIQTESDVNVKVDRSVFIFGGLVVLGFVVVGIVFALWKPKNEK